MIDGTHSTHQSSSHMKRKRFITISVTLAYAYVCMLTITPHQPMRHISFIIIHCSAVRPFQTSSAAQIDQWHKQRGWKGIGYHYVVRRDGSIERGRPEAQTGAHCQGHNAHSIGVCYEGGLDMQGKPSDTRTTEQRKAMLRLLTDLKQRYPKAIIVGHNMFSTKACPCFLPEEEYKEMNQK